MKDEDNKFLEWGMSEALAEAKKAPEHDDIPIGAIVIHEGRIIGRGHNQKELRHNSQYHGEMIALHEAMKALGDWHLNDCTLFVTLEPCAMCAGAMLNTRLGRLVYGAKDGRMGCAGSALDLLHYPGFNHRVEVIAGVLEEECSRLISDFFKTLRQR